MQLPMNSFLQLIQTDTCNCDLKYLLNDLDTKETPSILFLQTQI